LPFSFEFWLIMFDLTYAVMAKKSKSTALQPAAITPRMRKHLERLQSRSHSGYFAWCRKHGFAESFEKSIADIDTEIALIDAETARVKVQSRLHHNPRKLISALCRGEIDAKDITRPNWHALAKAIAASKNKPEDRAALEAFLLWAEAETDILFEQMKFGGVTYNAFDGLIKLNDRRGQWLRPVSDWKSPSHNARKQFSSLVRHLATNFPVPDFMDAAWVRTGTSSRRLREWFLHIGTGKNIRTANLPIPFTKMMAHHFLNAPSSFSIEGGLRWGQVHGLDGDERLTTALIGTRLGQHFDNDDFWTTVIKFFIANPMLDRQHVNPIVDYITAQRFMRREVMVAPGQVQIEEPPQPNLTMRGRTPDTLLAQVERWHHGLAKMKGGENLLFRASGFKPLTIKSGGKESKSEWRLRELLSSAELQAEGKAMRHCVSTYARSCFDGRCSIWTMELATPLGIEKRQTVEVAKDGAVRQCRGRQNRLPTAAEYDILSKWAAYAGLTIAPHVLTQR
jgi:PcfJ-like protein